MKTLNKLLRILAAITLTVLLLLSGCTKYTCATYSYNKPISKWDTTAATYVDVEEYMRSDTTKHKFSNMEKTGAVLFTLFAVFTVSRNIDEN